MKGDGVVRASLSAVLGFVGVYTAFSAGILVVLLKPDTAHIGESLAGVILRDVQGELVTVDISFALLI
jgi:hypothetical protein